MKVQILFLAGLMLLPGCKKQPTLGEVLAEAGRNDVRIESIMQSGIKMCEDDVVSSGLDLQDPDTWSPTAFSGGTELSRLTGFKVRFVSFYYEDGKFTGMIMNARHDFVLYKSHRHPPRLIIAGNYFLPASEKIGEYGFYRKHGNAWRSP